MVNKDVTEGTVLQPELLTNRNWEENTITHVGITESGDVTVVIPLQPELLANKYWEGNIISHGKQRM